jgi:DNA-binding response OmpR family regulator
LHYFERGEELVRRLKRESFDLLILDWQLPDITGFAILRWARQCMEAPPKVIMLTNRTSESDVVMALSAGADDYIQKPFRINEFKARVSTVLRRSESNQSKLASVNDLSFDDAELIVTLRGRVISLTDREYRLARCLFTHLYSSILGKPTFSTQSADC